MTPRELATALADELAVGGGMLITKVPEDQIHDLILDLASELVVDFREALALIDEMQKAYDDLSGQLPTGAANQARTAKADRLAARVRSLRAKGRTIPEVAKAVDRTDRHVLRLLKRPTDPT